MQAGSVLDYGQLIGLPAQANYVAWVENGGVPSEVLTEDGYNSSLGVDQGYKNQVWRLNASNFAASPSSGDTLNFIFGGLGADTGSIWFYSAAYNISNPTTDHGTVNTVTTVNARSMRPGSWSVPNKVIEWNGPAGTYHIYRSQNPSGAGNGASNGLYAYVDTVTTTAAVGTYTDTDVSVETWHIVVPADPTSGAIVGCHSEESSPTALHLASWQATPVAPAAPVWLLFAAVLLSASSCWVWQRSR